jgi:hypothetical protein
MAPVCGLAALLDAAGFVLLLRTYYSSFGRLIMLEAAALRPRQLVPAHGFLRSVLLSLSCLPLLLLLLVEAGGPMIQGMGGCQRTCTYHRRRHECYQKPSHQTTTTLL